MTTIPRLNETALFRRTLARAITLPVFLLIVLALIFLWQLNSLLDAAHWVDHTDQTIAKAHTLQELLIDQETGLRGYAITGVPDFLDPYRQAQAAIDPTFDELDGLVADNTAQQALVKAIRSNYGRWLVYSRELIGVRDRGGDYAGFVQQRTGKQLMDAMRAQIQSFLRIQVALRDQRSQAAQFTTQIVIVSSIAGALLLGLIVALFLRRQLLDLSGNYRRALDASEQRAAELKAAAQRYRDLSDAMPLVVWTARGDGAVDYFNRRWFQYTGMREDQALGWGWSDVLHPDDAQPTADRWNESLRSGTLFEIEYRWRRGSDGTYRWQLGRGVPVRDGAGKIAYWVGTGTDIDDQKQAETALRERGEELARTTTALEERNRELDQFAYITSHDLKAPLRGIANLSQWIEEDLGDNATDDIRKQLELLRGRVHRMEGLIEGLLQYSRIGRVKGAIEPVDVGVLLHDVIDLVAGPSGFSIEIAADMPTILTDRLRLQQVFQNLISNAIKHHNRADGHVEVSVRDIGRMYEFALADDGPGIAPEYHEKIFVIFQTLAARDKVEGTGIGLALIKKIVENHGGRVWVESAEGTGTTFRFTWPKRTREG
ncbi:MAG TPA: CHASE3 domain-containing protein [Roseiflexaceae bacterium]|nr:CHASE3 domain-containing protein [Roseiflexaceae bacterium]